VAHDTGLYGLRHDPQTFRPSLTAAREAPIDLFGGINEETMSNEIDFLKNFAASTGRSGFGTPGFKLDGTNGAYHRFTDKTGPKMNGQRWAATVADVMGGYQRIEKGKSPIYAVGRISDGFVPPDRAELGDLPEPGEKDPWTPAAWLPFWHQETHEVLLLHAANAGSRKAVGNLAQAYAVHREAHPDQADYDPLIELNADHYDGKHRRIFYPLFDIIDWVQRPERLLRVIPPSAKALDLVALPSPTVDIPIKQQAPDFDDNILEERGS